MITAQMNRRQNYLALLLLATLLLIGLLSGCRPSLEACNKYYPPQISENTTTVIDSTQQPFIIILPGDTVFLTGNVSRPCPDSTAQWKKFTNQVNFILNQNKKYKQTIEFQNNKFTYQMKVANDSVLKYKTLYTIEVTKNKTIAVPVAVFKVPAWCYWSLAFTALVIIASIIGFVSIIKKRLVS